MPRVPFPLPLVCFVGPAKVLAIPNAVILNVGVLYIVKQKRRAFTESLWTTLQRGALAGGCAVMDIADCTAASSAEWKFPGGTAAERRG